VAVLFGVKIAGKFVGVYPLALRYLPKRATYTTLLMSTGLTFGTIASLYGLQSGYIDKTQFTILVTVVIATAIIPTIIAQRFFQPPLAPATHEGADGALEAAEQ
jgi:Kef-type K+ transport system membrane component KefB